MLKWFIPPPAVLLLCACSSEPYRWPESDVDGPAPGSAYTAAASFLRAPMPDRRNFRAWEFYFKHCSRVSVDRPWFSKTQYDCNGPY